MVLLRHGKEWEDNNLIHDSCHLLVQQKQDLCCVYDTTGKHHQHVAKYLSG